MAIHIKWVKELDLGNYLSFGSFPRKDSFMKLGEIGLDEQKKTNGEKKRISLWNVNIAEGMVEEYKKRQNGVYIITCNNEIIKIGGTKTGMKDRIGSYHCGHYIPGMKKKNGDICDGRMSITNAYVYWTIYENIKKGHQFELYFFPIPDQILELEIFGIIKRVPVQTYDAYESATLDLYKSIKGCYPILSDNGHPE